MHETGYVIKAPLAWLPAGLISWYAAGGVPAALVTSWVALLGGGQPRLRTAWHGRHDPLSRFWPGGDFVFNIPSEQCLYRIQSLMCNGRFCLNAEADLQLRCLSGIAAAAPRLADCAVQLECVGGRLCDSGYDTELIGEVARLHRGGAVVDPSEIPDLCAIQPLSMQP